MARSADQTRLIAYQRFGLGPRLGASVVGDLRSAVLDELAKPDLALVTPAELSTAAQSKAVIGAGGIDNLPALGGAAPAITGTAMFAAHIADEARVQAQRKDRKLAAQAAPQMVPGADAAPSMAASPVRPVLPEPPRPAELFFRREVLARFNHAYAQPVGFVERLVQFWSNHFTVSIQKGLPLRALAGPFEREAIRPNVLGTFETMLLAVERHQAMLIYLDNRGSIGPNSRAGQNGKRGLNENLAREILELHTLGVAGGYSQSDVTALARILTGWTVAGAEGRLGAPGATVFNANAHEPGSHGLLGKVYAEDGGGQAEAALRDLARHPSTATFIATKLVRHFVADDPPKVLVARLEKVFRDTGGHLGAVSRALIEAEEAWAAPLTKLRGPYEFLVAAVRATDRPPVEPGPVNASLNAMGQPLWGAQGPNGYSDSVATLAVPEAMKTRLEVAAAVARRVGGALNPAELADSLYGGALSSETRQAISRAESKPQGLALLLMSPEFMRR